MPDQRDQNEAMRQAVREAGFVPPPYHAGASNYDHSLYAFEEGEGAKVLDMRGWGFLCGGGALNLPPEEAAKIQDATKAFILTACNSHQQLVEHATWIVKLFGTKDPQGQKDLLDEVKALKAVLQGLKGE